MYNMVHLYCRCDIVFDCRLVEVNNDCNNVHVWANVHRSFNLLNDSIFVPPATIYLLHCVLASCGAVYCNRSCLWVCDSGRCLNLTTASACTVFASLWVLFASFQVSAGHVRPSHIRCCWTKDMELVLWQFAWTWQLHFVARWRHSSLNNTQHTRGVRLAMMHCINWHWHWHANPFPFSIILPFCSYSTILIVHFWLIQAYIWYRCKKPKFQRVKMHLAAGLCLDLLGELAMLPQIP